jgi:glycosyltransferase involved in cell wall biosynthesis
MDTGDRLAVLGGFMESAPSVPYGTLQAMYRMCQAIAGAGRWKGIDVFHEDAPRKRPQVRLPTGVESRLLERTALKAAVGVYAAIYVANGEQIHYVPHTLRPEQDPAPVVCDIGMAHSPKQWTHIFLSAWTGALRDTDGFIFKAHFLERMFRETWDRWSQWVAPLPRPKTIVSPNGVDLQINSRSDGLRSETRRQLGLGADDVVFLTFSRLDPSGKGDFRALVLLWKSIAARWPRALLVLSGAKMASELDRGHVLQLRSAAREAGVGNNVLVIDDPYVVWPDARERLMSAADVFVHLSTGAEEVSSSSILEAMAFGLPVIAARWAGFPDAVEQGSNGFLVPTLVEEPPVALQRMMLGQQAFYSNADLERHVTCDGQAVVNAAGSLMAAPLRLEMGRASRRRAEASFAIDKVATRRVTFLEALAREARRPGLAQEPRPMRDLIDYRTLLSCLSGRPPGRPDGG